MTDCTVPLLRRTPLLPGESLPSLVERLAQLNHYGGTSVLTWLCRAQQAFLGSPDRVGRPLCGGTFLRLAHLTQLPVAELIAASAHYFTPALAPTGAAPTTADWLVTPDQPRALPSRAHLSLRPIAAAQYCPQCLQQAHYHRLSWLPAPVTDLSAAPLPARRLLPGLPTAHHHCRHRVRALSHLPSRSQRGPGRVCRR